MISVPSIISFKTGQVLQLTQTELGKRTCIIKWTSMGKIGVVFNRPLSNVELSTILKSYIRAQAA
jgi:hypothetical protein